MATKEKTAKVRNKVKQLFKEELYKQLVAPPTARKVGATLTEAQLAPFGAWVKRQFNSRSTIPESTKDKGVLQFLLENPNAARLSPTQLIEMFNVIPSIRTGLGKSAEDDEQSEESKPAQWDTTLASIGKDSDITLGKKQPLTASTVKNIEEKAKTLLEAVGDIRSLPPEEVTALTSKFDDVVDTAAEKYLGLLKAAGGNMSRLLPVLAKVALIPENAVKESELVALQYLMDLAVEGNDEKVIELLIRDINRDGPKGNILKTFQNVVAQVFSPETRRTRGRPLGSKNKKAI